MLPVDRFKPAPSAPTPTGSEPVAEPVPDRFRPGAGGMAGEFPRRDCARDVGRHGAVMDTNSYSLSTLARLSGRSKVTLGEMVQEGRLQGTRSQTGRLEWQFTRSAALAAGLTLSEPGTSIDSAFAHHLLEAVQPLMERFDLVDDHLAVLRSAMGELTQLPESVHSRPGFVGRTSVLARFRWWLIRLLMPSKG